MNSTIIRVLGLKFKATATGAEIAAILNALNALPQQISEIQSLSGGFNISQEGRNKGFTHIFVLSFRSANDLFGYAKHPAHDAFVKLLLTQLEDSIELDCHEKGLGANRT